MPIHNSAFCCLKRSEPSGQPASGEEQGRMGMWIWMWMDDWQAARRQRDEMRTRTGDKKVLCCEWGSSVASWTPIDKRGPPESSWRQRWPRCAGVTFTRFLLILTLLTTGLGQWQFRIRWCKTNFKDVPILAANILSYAFLVLTKHTHARLQKKNTDTRMRSKMKQRPKQKYDNWVLICLTRSQQTSREGVKQNGGGDLRGLRVGQVLYLKLRICLSFGCCDCCCCCCCCCTRFNAHIEVFMTAPHWEWKWDWEWGMGSRCGPALVYRMSWHLIPPAGWQR